MVINLVASLLALIGTWIQMKDQLGKLSSTDPSAYSAFKAVGELRGEHASVLHPVGWARARLIVNSLLQGSRSEAEDYRRAARAVFSWSYLLAATILIAAVTLWDLIASAL